ncbi:MAG: BatA domain-containing protein [Verrucomicrobia subdivision 3 bacterium]|nr:BatA domain-containing protein [Limisphaerales bacterium]
MSLLFPLALLGIAAIAAPLWLHLRRKTDPRLIRFSTLRFLQDSPSPERRPLRLRDILLFALRCLAVVALALAFAWPFVRESKPTIIRESRVYILDNTFSHQANDGVAKARDRIMREISSLGSDVQVAVVELAGAPIVLAGFGDDRLALEQKLRDLQPSHQRGSYLAAFRQANALLENSFGEKKRIIFQTDNQENQWTEHVHTAPFLQNTEVSISPPLAKLANLSLAFPKLQRIFLGEKSIVTFSAKLSHDGSAPRTEVVLKADGQVLLSKTLDLERKPETVSLQTEWEADANRWISGELTAQYAGDALASDNTLYFTHPPVREGTVAVLAQSAYLRLALSPEVMRGHWGARMIDPAKISEQLASENDAEVLCIESGYLQSPDARKLVWRYLTNGRGVILAANRVSPAVAGALRELGIEADSPAEGKRSGNLVYIASNHPIFHPFRSPDYGNLGEVKVHRHTRLRAAQGMPLVFGESGDVLLFQGTRFPGKLLVCSFGFEREQTSWPLHLTFIPFLDLALQHCRPTGEDGNNFECGETTTISLPQNSSAREVTVGGARFAVNNATAQIRLPDKPGIYEVSFDSAAEPARRFSVNPPPRESQLGYVSNPEAPAIWTVPNEKGPVAQAGTVPASALSRTDIFRQHWWWWLALAGLVALVTEMLWSSARKAQI